MIGVESKNERTATGPTDSLPFSMELAHSRGNILIGIAFRCVLTKLAMDYLGGVGIVLGVYWLFRSAELAYLFVRTLRHPPGKIQVKRNEVILPFRLCVASASTLKPSDIRNVYVLRRAVPYSAGGSLLVVETAHGTFEYPRAWFAADGDPARVQAAFRQLARAQ